MSQTRERRYEKKRLDLFVDLDRTGSFHRMVPDCGCGSAYGSSWVFGEIRDHFRVIGRVFLLKGMK